MPTGGKLTLELADVEIDPDYLVNQPDALPGRYVMLSVRDTGVGMDEATKEHVFDPFFTTKPVGQGTGLGLAMVYGFVTQSGGFVDLDSQPGQGTEFRIYLPWEDRPGSAEPGENAPQRSRLPQQQSGTILVVEDEQRVRRLITQVLQRCGYSVHQFSNVDAAEEFLTQGNGTIDLVITDVVMPGRSGLDLAEHIRQSARELPILFISGYAHDTVLQHGEGKMPERLLAKPFTPQQLAQAVKEILEE
jgi:CheY-like chemotaxis protein